METALRSLVKAVLWTVLGLGVMTIVGFAFTGSLETGGAMALLNASLGLVLYLFYERLWARISWGRDVPTE